MAAAPTKMSEYAVICHPDTPSKSAPYIGADVRISDACLELRYRLEGEIAQLRVPELDTPARTDKLWQHTCFEVFVKHPKRASYYEFNFSPSTRWAIYRFDRFREGMSSVAVDRPPRIAVNRSEHILTLECRVDLAQFQDLAERDGYRLALSAVVEDHDGQLSYWALAHPPGKPDFHHRDGFVLSLQGSVE